MIRFLFLFSAAVGSLLAQDYAVIFMYHRFDNPKYPSTSITKEQFAFQLDYLQKHRYNVWPLSKIVRYIEAKKELPPKTVALTIDDAYKSVYTVAYPMLKAKKFPFTVFVNTGPIDHRSKAYMSWDNLREMGNFGAEYGNHTKYHPFLLKYITGDDAKDFQKFKKDIEGAQKRLQTELTAQCNSNPKLFAYPFGEYDTKIKTYIRRLGYVAFGQNSGVLSFDTPLDAIPRYPMSQRFATKKGFLLKLHTKPLPLARQPQVDNLITDRNPPLLRLQLQKHFSDLGCFTSSGEPLLMQWIDRKTVQIRATKPLAPPRDHYTCTAKADKKSWYWYSFFWVFPKK